MFDIFSSSSTASFHSSGHNTYRFEIMYLDSDVSVVFDPSLIECSLGGIMMIYDKSHTYSHVMIEGLMIF